MSNIFIMVMHNRLKASLEGHCYRVRCETGLQFDVDNPVRPIIMAAEGPCKPINWRLSVQVIGLTGGIATGKSTVSAILEKAGAVIIDADRIARTAVKKGQPSYKKIVAHFGANILLPDGEINRSLLGEIIFNNPQKKQLLNRIVHPHVRREQDRQLKQIKKNEPDAIVVLDIPLLFESQMAEDLSEIVVVYAPEHIQVKRLMKRDNISKTAALARVHSQMPIEEKKKKASIVIDNSGSLEDTRKQTLEVFKIIKEKLT